MESGSGGLSKSRYFGLNRYGSIEPYFIDSFSPRPGGDVIVSLIRSFIQFGNILESKRAIANVCYTGLFYLFLSTQLLVISVFVIHEQSSRLMLPAV